MTARHVLLTGATDGIGLALARLYAADGARLTLVGRRPLTDLDPDLFTPSRYCRADLGHGDAVATICRHLDERAGGPPDLVIHNAGVGWIGDIADQSAASIRALVTVNLWTPIALTRALLASLGPRRGKVVFIGSIAAAIPCPGYAVYAATKAALGGFARSLRVELGNQVAVQVIHPGATRSGMHAKAGGVSSPRFAAPQRVAAAVKQAIAGSRPVVTIGVANAALSAGGRGPTTLVDVAARRLQSLGVVPAPPAQPSGRRRSAVVTGAANGIGGALARRLVGAGYSVLGVDSDRAAIAAARAASAAGDDLRFAEVELADDQSIAALVRALADAPPIDVLVHNAAISAVGPFAAAPLAAQRTVLLVNLLAPMVLTAGLLAERCLARGAAVVLVSSLSHFVSYPGASVYAASKDGLASYARSLFVAGAGHDLHCLTAYPGPTRTEHARRYAPPGASAAGRMPPEQVAEAIMRALRRRRRTVIPGAANRLAALVGRAWPGLAERTMRRLVFERLVV